MQAARLCITGRRFSQQAAAKVTTAAEPSTCGSASA